MVATNTTIPPITAPTIMPLSELFGLVLYPLDEVVGEGRPTVLEPNSWFVTKKWSNQMVPSLILAMVTLRVLANVFKWVEGKKWEAGRHTDRHDVAPPTSKIVAHGYLTTRLARPLARVGARQSSSWSRPLLNLSPRYRTLKYNFLYMTGVKDIF
jgi:hypothetical protein